MKRKTISEETGKTKMDAPANVDGSEHPANPLPNPPETFPPEERPLHEGFMREALAMVCTPSPYIIKSNPIKASILTKHRHNSLSTQTRLLSVVSLCITGLLLLAA